MEQGLATMSAIETLRAYRTLQNADNVDDAIAEITRAYEELDRLRAQVADLEAGMMEYACTGTEHPCGCYTLLKKDRAQVAELRGKMHTAIDDMKSGLITVGEFIDIARTILAKTLPTDDWHDPFFVKLRQSKTEDPYGTSPALAALPEVNAKNEADIEELRKK